VIIARRLTYAEMAVFERERGTLTRRCTHGSLSRKRSGSIPAEKKFRPDIGSSEDTLPRIVEGPLWDSPLAIDNGPSGRRLCDRAPARDAAEPVVDRATLIVCRALPPSA